MCAISRMLHSHWNCHLQPRTKQDAYKLLLFYSVFSKSCCRTMNKGKFFTAILPSSFQGSEGFKWSLMNDMNSCGISSHMVNSKKVMREQHKATVLPAWLQQFGEGETSLIPVSTKCPTSYVVKTHETNVKLTITWTTVFSPLHNSPTRTGEDGKFFFPRFYNNRAARQTFSMRVTVLCHLFSTRLKIEWIC